MAARRDTVSITQLKAQAAELVRGVAEERRTLTVTQNGEPKVVVVGLDAWEDLQDTMTMLELLAQSESEIARGERHSSEDVFAAARATRSTSWACSTAAGT